MTDPRVLDVCCGSRMMWFDRQNPDAVYCDKRSESHVLCDGRELHVKPDLISDFRNLPFDNESFPLVVFDPPHLKSAGPKSWLRAKYGVLSGDWRVDLQMGFVECFRVLKPDGTLIFKWNEDQVKIREVVDLAPYPPLFGHPTGQNGRTHWMVFMKPRKPEGADT